MILQATIHIPESKPKTTKKSVTQKKLNRPRDMHKAVGYVESSIENVLKCPLNSLYEPVGDTLHYQLNKIQRNYEALS